MRFWRMAGCKAGIRFAGNSGKFFAMPPCWGLTIPTQTTGAKDCIKSCWRILFPCRQKKNPLPFTLHQKIFLPRKESRQVVLQKWECIGFGFFSGFTARLRNCKKLYFIQLPVRKKILVLRLIDILVKLKLRTRMRG